MIPGTRVSSSTIIPRKVNEMHTLVEVTDRENRNTMVNAAKGAPDKGSLRNC